MSVKIRNNTPQLIELHWEGGTHVLLPDADLNVAEEMLATGQMEYLTRMGRVSLELPAIQVLAEQSGPATVEMPVKKKSSVRKKQKR